MTSQYYHVIPRMGLAVIVLAAAIGWVSGWKIGLGAGILGLGLLTLHFWIGRDRVREAVWSGKTQRDLLHFYRAELDRRIASVGRVIWIELVMGAFLTVLSGVHVSGLLESSEPSRRIVFWGVLGFVLLGVGLYRRFIQLPRLRSERSEIA
jgi:hypothetical protein